MVMSRPSSIAKRIKEVLECKLPRIRTADCGSFDSSKSSKSIASTSVPNGCMGADNTGPTRAAVPTDSCDFGRQLSEPIRHTFTGSCDELIPMQKVKESPWVEKPTRQLIPDELMYPWELDSEPFPRSDSPPVSREELNLAEIRFQAVHREKVLLPKDLRSELCWRVNDIRKPARARSCEHTQRPPWSGRARKIRMPEQHPAMEQLPPSHTYLDVDLSDTSESLEFSPLSVKRILIPQVEVSFSDIVPITDIVPRCDGSTRKESSRTKCCSKPSSSRRRGRPDRDSCKTVLDLGPIVDTILKEGTWQSLSENSSESESTDSDAETSYVSSHSASTRASMLSKKRGA